MIVNVWDWRNNVKVASNKVTSNKFTYLRPGIIHKWRHTYLKFVRHPTLSVTLLEWRHLWMFLKHFSLIIICHRFFFNKRSFNQITVTIVIVKKEDKNERISEAFKQWGFEFDLSDADYCKLLITRLFLVQLSNLFMY